MKLLTTSQHHRIGSLKLVDEILAHEWFSELDLPSLQDQTMVSPIYDIVTNKDCILELIASTAEKEHDTLFWVK